jgi:hypothetical protein
VPAEVAREAQHLAALAAFCADRDGAARAQRLARAAGEWQAVFQRPALPPLTTSQRAHLRCAPQWSRWPPACRALYACWQKLHWPLHFDWSGDPLLQLPALEGWRLYEIWCFLTVADCLLRNGWIPLASSSNNGILHCAPDGMRLRLATGRASMLRFRPPGRGRATPLLLSYQPLFASANRRPTGDETEQLNAVSRHEAEPDAADDAAPLGSCRSLTHDMQPDIVLQWRGRLYVLDAKYRRYASREAANAADDGAYNALIEDLDKMHTYRDSIVHRGRRAVHHAWCLFPGRPHLDPRIVAYPAGAPERPYGTAGIGAVALRPGSPMEALTGLLDCWFAASRS